MRGWSGAAVITWCSWLCLKSDQSCDGVGRVCRHNTNCLFRSRLHVLRSTPGGRVSFQNLVVCIHVSVRSQFSNGFTSCCTAVAAADQWCNRRLLWKCDPLISGLIWEWRSKQSSIKKALLTRCVSVWWQLAQTRTLLFISRSQRAEMEKSLFFFFKYGNVSLFSPISLGNYGSSTCFLAS